MTRNKRADWFLVAAFIAAGFGLARWQTAARDAGRTDPPSALVRGVISPAARAMDAAAYGGADLFGALVDARRLQRENQRLAQFEAAASTYVADVERLSAEVRELRSMGGWSPGPGRDKVPADVIGYFALEDRMTLDVGRDHGIKKGMPVITYEGLVGRIETVDQNTSQALLITSTAASARLSALVERKAPNPLPAGLVRGEGQSALRMELADPTATVESGDVVITSGFSDTIPRGIVIGKVVAVQDDPAFGKRTATVFPKVSAGQVKEVLIVK